MHELRCRPVFKKSGQPVAFFLSFVICRMTFVKKIYIGFPSIFHGSNNKADVNRGVMCPWMAGRLGGVKDCARLTETKTDRAEQSIGRAKSIASHTQCRGAQRTMGEKMRTIAYISRAVFLGVVVSLY